MHLASVKSANAPTTDVEGAWFELRFQIGLLTLLGLGTLFSNAMGLSQLSFNARVSDPLIGATYMTLFSTLNSIG